MGKRDLKITTSQNVFVNCDRTDGRSVIEITGPAAGGGHIDLQGNKFINMGNAVAIKVTLTEPKPEQSLGAKVGDFAKDVTAGVVATAVSKLAGM